MPRAASKPGLRGGPLETNGERVKIFRCMNFFHKTNVCMIFFFLGTSFAPFFRLRAGLLFFVAKLLHAKPKHASGRERGYTG